MASASAAALPRGLLAAEIAFGLVFYEVLFPGSFWLGAAIYGALGRGAGSGWLWHRQRPATRAPRSSRRSAYKITAMPEGEPNRPLRDFPALSPLAGSAVIIA